MRVLVLATTFPRWQDDTTPAFVYELSRRLKREGFDIVVLAPHSEGSQIKEAMEGLKVYRFPYFYPRRYQRLCYEGGILENIKRSRLAKVQVPLLFLSQLYHALKLTRRAKVDMIHAHWIVPAGLVGAICSRVFEKPLVVTVHAGDVFPLKAKWMRYLARVVLGACDACTVNSSATGEAISSIGGVEGKMRVIPMGVDLDVFRPSLKSSPAPKRYNIEGPVILTVGRLVEKKGVSYLIESLPQILGRIPKVKLIICGDGPERGKLVELRGRLNLTESVVFAGSIPNRLLPEFYTSATLFALPSIIDSAGDTEGLGVVLLEAMACATPVVGSDVGGIPDIIKDGWNGFLVEQKNPQALAEKIGLLLADGELRRRFSENGLQTVKALF